MNPDISPFPFQCVLSFEPLLRLWERIRTQGDRPKAAMAGVVLEEVKKQPELSGPIEDLSRLHAHRDLVELLLTIAFPPAFQDTDLAAAFRPFHFESIYATPAFDRLLLPHLDDFSRRSRIEVERWAWGKEMKAYMRILRQCYGVAQDFDYPLVVEVKAPDSDLLRCYKILMDPRFVDVRQIEPPPRLDEKAKEELLQNISDLPLLRERIPPRCFELRGIGIFRAVDVTDQEIMSSLKRDLIERGSLFSKERFGALEQKIRSFLAIPDLSLSLGALKGGEVLLLTPEDPFEKGCIFTDSTHMNIRSFDGTVFARAIEMTEPLVIEDLQAYPHRTALEDDMIRHGIRSLFIAPLFYQSRLLGTFGLKSRTLGGLNSLNTQKLQEILPLFSIALNRGLEELDHRVQAVIKEQCTAIHPSVEWRFQQAALKYLSRSEGDSGPLEPIVFRDVYPLYGESDVRGSSSYRNAAIQSDLIAHLQMAKEIVVCAKEQRSLPVLDALVFQINKNIQEIQDGLHSDDEVSRMDFIRFGVEPVFEHIQTFGPGVTEKIQSYRGALDPQTGALHRKRKDFEESITAINAAIAEYLEEEEKTAQGYFPHYFEMTKTDGVDHTLYIGGSMVQDGKFDRLYLRNLRLWQLLVMCGIAWRTEQLKERLRVPLDTTHLILVQNTPLSIRFRHDERRFDVDGAYDMRHEIIKKRIDKALLKDGRERLTQPRKIAVVYSNREEALEYREYIEYLQAKGCLAETVERLELQDFQGVQGLKALRVMVNTESSAMEQPVSPEAVQDAVNRMQSAAA